jgi:type II secretory pathway pseudopilin PulG
MILNKTNKQGVTIIELLIVIAAAVGLIAAGLVLFQDLQASTRLKDETTNLAALFTGVSKTFKDLSLADRIADIDNALIIQAGIPTPTQRTEGLASIFNVWGGAVTIGTDAGVAAQTPNAFSVQYDRVPMGSSCVDFIEGQRQAGWDSVDLFGAGAAEMSSINVTDIISECDEIANGDFRDALVFIVD